MIVKTRTRLIALLLTAPLRMMANGFTPADKPALLQQHHKTPGFLSHHRDNHHAGWWKEATDSIFHQKPFSSLAGTAATMALAMLLSSAPSFAADFAKKDISGMDFSGQDLSQKDFTGVIAKNTNFHNSNLEKSNFNKAILANADFSGANVREATFLDATLDGSSFKNALAENSVFSTSILDIGDLENVDLTNSLWPSKLRIMICDMDELKGTNPVTGIESRDSLMCTDYIYK